MSKPKILGISGSLKLNSNNTALLKILQQLTPNECDFELFSDLGTLPHFNPDNEAGNLQVTRFKEQLREAEGVVICTPEYAFGPPGVLKNALDWTVHSGQLHEKPVALISSSPLYDGGKRAMASLALTLQALGTHTPEKWKLSIGDVKSKLKVSPIDRDTYEKLDHLYSSFVAEILNNKRNNLKKE